MKWNNDLTTLNTRLAMVYRRSDDANRIATMAGLDTSLIDISGSPYNIWFKILQYAIRSNDWNEIIQLLELVSGPYELGTEDETFNGLLENFRKGQFSVQSPERTASAPSEVDEKKGLEVLMAPKSNLLPISFLEQGVKSALAVVRIVTPSGLGSGFMVDNHLLVTNNHVIGSMDIAKQAKVQFNFQKTLYGLDEPFEEFSLDPDVFFVTSTDKPETEALDYTIVKVKGEVSKFGKLKFAPNPVSKNDFVNIGVVLFSRTVAKRQFWNYSGNTLPQIARG